MTEEEYRKKYPNYYKCTHCGAPSHIDKPLEHKSNCTNTKPRRKHVRK